MNNNVTEVNETLPPMFTIQELADRWKANRHSLYQMVYAGDLRTVRLGKRGHRIPAHEVLRHENFQANQ